MLEVGRGLYAQLAEKLGEVGEVLLAGALDLGWEVERGGDGVGMLTGNEASGGLLFDRADRLDPIA